jgi:peptidylprolyl isomerase/peptidyl-prolyl cis-trans isomerase D
VKQKVYDAQLDKAGIIIGEKDIWDAMVNNQNIQNDQRFKNEAGLFDENKLKEYVAGLIDDKGLDAQSESSWLAWVNYERNVKANLEQSTYNNLVKSGLLASLKEGERSYVSKNTNADIELVYNPYNSINDSLVKITDAEITNYIKSHANDFKAEASRNIEFVKFEVKPSDDDIAEVKKNVAVLINDHPGWNKAAGANENIIGFVNVTNNKEFVTSNSDIPFADKLFLPVDLPSGVFDSISKLKENAIYGPFRDDDYFKLIKLIKKENLRSAKSSHILIAYEGATRAIPTVKRTKEEAEAFAKTLLKKVNKNNFADLAKENSNGSSASKGGDIGWFKNNGGLAEEFNDYIFSNRIGKIGLIETSFGFHILKVDETKSEPGLKLAIVARKIDPSEVTESKIYQEAETFASDLTNGKDLLELAKEKNYAVKYGLNLSELSENITGLGNQREIVKWTFEKDAKIGDIKRFDLDNGDYVVAYLKKKNKKGLTAMAIAKSKVRPILIKQKKYEMLKEKMKGNTLKEIASSIKKTVNSAKNISVSNPSLPVGGRDLNIVGSILFMKEGDIEIVKGNNGAYAIKVIKKTTPFQLKNFNTYTNTIATKLQSRSSQIYNALKNSAEIEDNRAFYY